MKNDIYGEPEIIQTENIIARVYSPILTNEERERRMNLIKKASVQMVLSKGVKKWLTWSLYTVATLLHTEVFSITSAISV